MSRRRGLCGLRRLGLVLLPCWVVLACAAPEPSSTAAGSPAAPPIADPWRGVQGPPRDPFLAVLGVAQDAGYPQAGCDKECCRAVREGARRRQHVVSLGLVDPTAERFWLFEATPDFTAQYDRLRALSPPSSTLGGVFLTHAHIGHYTGLVFLGREALGARAVPVFAMPRMRRFLETDEPWRQLVELGNVRLEALSAAAEVSLGGGLGVRPFLVPHRDEISETVGFEIRGPRRTVVFLPDIDKWSRWQGSLPELLGRVDRAYLDATFFDPDELPGRDMAEIPHPFVPETMDLLRDLPPEQRAKVHFIHFNHTNALLEPGGAAQRQVEAAGFAVAREGDVLEL